MTGVKQTIKEKRNMLTLSEIFDIVVATFTSFRRQNEILDTDISAADTMFAAITADGGLTDDQWDFVDAEQPLICGLNCIHIGNGMADSMAAIGFGTNMVEHVRSFAGKIFIYADAISMDAYQHCLTAEQIRRYVMFVMLHERRHTWQNAEDIHQQYTAMPHTDGFDIASYEAMSVEQDANDWATAQLTYVYGM